LALTTALTIAGNLTADPELRESQGGKAYVRFTVAANPRQFNRETKEWEDGEAVFQRCVAFGTLAEHVGHSLRKGQRVIAQGTMKAESWTDKDSGTKRTEKILQCEDVGLSLVHSNAEATKSAPRQDADSQADTWAANDDDTPF
jgi:single-strand DNA-binding protein